MSEPTEPTPSIASTPPRRARRGVVWIMMAVFVWGAILAAGTYLYRYEAEPGGIGHSRAARRTVLVLGCTGGFIAVWGAALAWRSRG